MAERTTIRTHLAPVACAERLQHLSSSGSYIVSRGRQVTTARIQNLKLVQGADGHYDFELRAKCRDRARGHLLASTVFLTVLGRVERADRTTWIQLAVRSGLPVSLGDWLLQLLWYGVLTAVVAALLLGAVTTGEVWLWRLSGGFTLVVALLYVLLARVYHQAQQALTTLLERAFAAPRESEPSLRIMLRR
jgi:hypothetical protein